MECTNDIRFNLAFEAFEDETFLIQAKKLFNLFKTI